MIAYASRTGTRQNLNFLRQNNWRLMISAEGVHRSEGFSYAIDNGAWTAYKKKIEFNQDRFYQLLETHGAAADFITVPDIVCGGLDSLRFSEQWLWKLIGCSKLLLIPVQDGMVANDLRLLLSMSQPFTGIFIGGSDEFKESTMNQWARLADDLDCYIHCGRVNSKRRLKLCQMHGIDSFDGSGPSRFLQHARVMNAQLCQQSLDLSP